MTIDERPAAVQHADRAAAGWRSVAHIQPATISDHSDLYAITGEIVETLWCLESVAGVLGQQIAGYGESHILRDDELGRDPAERVASAADYARQLAAAIARAERIANLLWSEIGHVAVEVGERP
jgi:hypothetical protein